MKASRAGASQSWKYIFIVALAVACAGSRAPRDPMSGARTGSARLEDLTWILGTWSGDHGDGRYVESWTRSSGDLFVGRSAYTPRGQAAPAETEQLSLERRADGSIYYVATPSDQVRTEFRLTASGAMTAVFENPTHDFPTRIAYRATHDGAVLQATISGPARDGGVRSATFDLRRQE